MCGVTWKDFGFHLSGHNGIDIFWFLAVQLNDNFFGRSIMKFQDGSLPLML